VTTRKRREKKIHGEENMKGIKGPFSRPGTHTFFRKEIFLSLSFQKAGVSLMMKLGAPLGECGT
jgi:hypothetical protein